jgi:hypothetical protein
MAGADIHIRFTYTADEYAEAGRIASKYYAGKQGGGWSRYILFMMVSVAGGPLLILGYPESRLALVIGGVAFGLGLSYMNGLSSYLWRMHFGLKKEFPRIEEFQGEREMWFDEEGHRTKGPRFSSAHSWDTFRRYAQTANLYVLFLPPGLFVILPKRAFSPSDLVAFNDLVSRKITGPAIAAPPPKEISSV